MLAVPESAEKMTSLLTLIGKADNVNADTRFMLGLKKQTSMEWMYVNGLPLGQYKNWATE